MAYEGYAPATPEDSTAIDKPGDVIRDITSARGEHRRPFDAVAKDLGSLVREGADIPEHVREQAHQIAGTYSL